MKYLKEFFSDPVIVRAYRESPYIVRQKSYALAYFLVILLLIIPLFYYKISLLSHTFKIPDQAVNQGKGIFSDVPVSV